MPRSNQTIHSATTNTMETDLIYITEDVYDNITQSTNSSDPTNTKTSEYYNRNTGFGAGFEDIFNDPPKKAHENTIQPSTDNETNASSLIDALSMAAPINLIGSALFIRAAIANPKIAKFIAPDNSTKSISKEFEPMELNGFLKRHTITPLSAKNKGFHFPPGHPQVGKSYKLHPLSNFQKSGKEKVYIPCECYDEILLEERESELLTLLVELGATRIEISQKNTINHSNDNSSSASVHSKIAGEIETKLITKSSNSDQNHDTREFELMGKPWKIGDKLDKSKFAWVSFEPSWNSLISAREVGGCLRATIEIKENSSSASDKEISAAVKARIYGGKASSNTIKEAQNEKTFIVRVEFSPLIS